MLGSKKSLIASAAVTVLAILVFLLPFEGLELQAKGALIVFFWVIMMWILRPIPEFLAAIFAAGILLVVFDVGGSDVTSGFSTTGWWLTIFATMLGGVLVVTNLGYRLSYWILVKLGTSPLKSMYATNMAGNILAAVMPSNTARGAILSGIVDNICDGLGYKAGEYKGDHGIMLSNLYTNTTNTFLFYTATGANIIGMTIVEEMTGKGITWSGWLLATCIPALAVLFIIPALCYKLFPPAEKKTMDVSFAAEKLKEMGPMSRKEKVATVVIFATLAMWATERLHGISSANVGFFMAVALLFPKFGACTWKEVENKIPWAQLIQLGYAMSIASVINKTGGFQWIVERLFLESGIFTDISFMWFMLIWLPIIVFMHIIFAGMNAMMAVLVPIGISLGVALGFDPYIVGLLTVMGISAGAFFMPFNSAPNLIFFGTGRFTVLQELKGAMIIAVLIVLSFIFALNIWWPLVGIL